jgi:hypothetical protein
MRTYIVRIQDGGSRLRGLVERPGEAPTTFRTDDELLAALKAAGGPRSEEHPGDHPTPGKARGSTSSSSIREQ